MKRIVGFVSAKKYLGRRKKRKNSRNSYEKLLLVIPVAVTLLISASGANAYLPMLGVGISSTFYSVLAYGILMNLTVWQVIVKPEMDATRRLIINVLPAELLLWLHLCRKDPVISIGSLYLIILVVFIVFVHSLIHKQAQDYGKRLIVLMRKFALGMILALLLSSVLSVISMMNQLVHIGMYIADRQKPVIGAMMSEGNAPAMSESEWENMNVKARLKNLQKVLDIALENMGVSQEVILIAREIETAAGEYVPLESSHLNEEIIIDIHYLENESLWNCVYMMLYEARHVYQRDLVASLDWQNEMILTNDYYSLARKWREELTNSTENVDGLDVMSCEEDARDYAWKSVWKYVLDEEFQQEE